MPLSKAQLMEVPGGPGVIGAIKAGDNCIIDDGVVSAIRRNAPVLSIIAGSGVTVTQNGNTYTISLTGYINTNFPTGTKTLFPQAAAPTGWIKAPSNIDNMALRIFTPGGIALDGVGFTQCFSSYTPTGVAAFGSSTATGNTQNTSLTPTGQLNITGLSAGGASLNIGQMTAHSHTVNGVVGCPGLGMQGDNFGDLGSGASSNNGSTVGGGGAHSHGVSGQPSFAGTASQHLHSMSAPVPTYNPQITGTPINLAIRYVDTLICEKVI